MRRGEIYFVDLDPTIGREQFGRRPVLVVSTDSINLAPLVVTVVPGTDAANVHRKRRDSVLVTAKESGLPIDTVFLCIQIRALDHSRFPRQSIGRLNSTRMGDIDEAMKFALGLQ